MTATSEELEGMHSGNESVLLSAILEAVSWKHALENTSEPAFQRWGQRIIVYSKCFSKFETVMTTGNVGLHLDGRHDIAYEKIMEECSGSCADCRPIFVREDSEAIGNWPVLADKVKIWMEDARLIAVGRYKQVLENGLDKCSSESDSENSDHGEEMSHESMYTPEMLGPDGNPKNGGPQKLSNTQVLALRSAARSAPSSRGPSIPGTPSTSRGRKYGKEVSSRLPTPLNSDNEDDADDMTEDQKGCLASAKRRAGRAGGRVTVAGSEKTDAGVARSHSSKT
jgi:hypothetical protein